MLCASTRNVRIEIQLDSQTIPKSGSLILASFSCIKNQLLLLKMQSRPMLQVDGANGCVASSGGRIVARLEFTFCFSCSSKSHRIQPPKEGEHGINLLLLLRSNKRFESASNGRESLLKPLNRIA